MNEAESDPDYDLRQVVLMEEQLSQFDAGKVSLAHIIAGLNSLVNCLRTPSQDWKNQFVSEWWTLEQVHAAALDRKKAALSPDDLMLIKQATVNLRMLIAKAKERLDGNQQNGG